MTAKLGSVTLAMAIAVLLVACAGDNVEPETIVPLAADADGSTVYEARCASCHGTDLGGTDKGPSQLSIVYEPGHHGDDAYRSAIRNGAQQHHWGFGAMPVIESITDEQIEAVISYIRGEQQRLGLEQ
jgi:mono/diheme cytochrome c family protein